MINLENNKIKNNELSVNKRRLDEMAWLLEGSSMCTAVCVITERFYISANEFFIKSEGKTGNQQLHSICNIMEYFRDVANSAILLEGRMQRRDEIMVTICKNQISVASFGRIVIPEQILKNVISSKILRENSLSNLSSNFEETKYFNKHLGYIYRAFSYGLDIYKRFLKIEKAIDKANMGNFEKITQHQLTAFKNFRHDDNDRLQSNILFLAKDESKSKAKLVHAEIQILDRIIGMLEEGIILPPGQIYIGISKRCCLNCHCLLDSANEILKDLNISIQFEGSHDASFLSGWGHPPFLLQAEKDTFGKTRNNTKIKSRITDLSLRAKIRQGYLDKIKIVEEVSDSYTLGHSPSSSDNSSDQSQKLERYKLHLMNDFEVFKKFGLEHHESADMLSIGIQLSEIDEFQKLFGPMRSLSKVEQKELFQSIKFKLQTKNSLITPNMLLKFLKTPVFCGERVIKWFSEIQQNDI